MASLDAVTAGALPSTGRRDLPSPRAEAAAGVVVAVATSLLGAPLGLLWAALAPHAVVVVRSGRTSLLDPLGRAFVGADLWFLALALLAGVLVALGALPLLRRFGPGPVLGLAVGGLLAAEIARRTGHLVGLDDARALVRSGQDGRTEVAVRLRSWQAVLAWPIGSLATFSVVLLARRPMAAARVAQRPAGADVHPAQPWGAVSPADAGEDHR